MRRFAVLLTVLAVLVVVGGSRSPDPGHPRRPPLLRPRPSEPDAGGEGGASRRRRPGRLCGEPRRHDPRPQPSARSSALAATGWAGEIQIANEDTWEPDVAADPSSPYVYAMYNRFGSRATAAQPADAGSASSGRWADLGAGEADVHLHRRGLAVRPGHLRLVVGHGLRGVDEREHDRVLEVDGSRCDLVDTGRCLGQELGGQAVDGGERNGTDVYIAYEPEQLQLTSSHNGGSSFSTPITVNTDNSVYRYPNRFVVLPNGTAVLSDSVLRRQRQDRGPRRDRGLALDERRHLVEQSLGR